MRAYKFLVPFLLINILLSAVCLAQESNAPALFPQQIPPSPEASTLGKYGEIPVGLATGTPNINIPIYNLQLNDFTFPLNVSYHGSGIKIEEIASSVGLGWCLNAGGVITRSVRGKPDDDPSAGYFIKGSVIPDPNINEAAFYSWQPDNNYLRGVANNNIDAEPDEYFFNFAGYSGRFIIDAQKNVYPCPFAKFKVTPGFGSNHTWIITTQDGNQFFFGENGATEGSTAIQSCNPGGGDNPETGAISSWYLTKIITANNQTISFTYSAPYEITYNINKSETRHDIIPGADPYVNGNGCTTYMYTQCSTLLTSSNIFLSKITWPGGEINLRYSARVDFDLPKVDSINITNPSNRLIKSFRFSYDYFSTGQNRRLKLNSINELNTNDLSIAKSYQFAYSNILVQPRDSKAQDYWGYYNGQNNSTLIPAEIGAYLDGANREPNDAYNQMGMLVQIKYPTGGVKNFEWESNSFGYKKNMPVTTTEALVPQQVSVHAPSNIDNQTTVTQTITVGGDQIGYVNYTTYKKANSTNSDPVSSTVSFTRVSDGKNMLQGVVNNDNKVYPVELKAGNYTIIAQAEDPDNFATCTVKWSEMVSTATKEKKCGGVRIKQVANYDLVTGKASIKKYSYQLPDEDRSSGVIMDYPTFYYVGYILNPYSFGNSSCNGCVVQCTYKIRQSALVNNLGSTQGSPISYSSVTVSDGDNNEVGKEVHNLTTFRNYLDKEVRLFPFPPNTSFDWRRGLDTEILYYNKQNQLIEQIKNKYYFNDATNGTLNHRIVGGLKAAYKKNDPLVDSRDEIAYETFEMISEWYYLKSTTKTQYDLTTGQSLSVTDSFNYLNPSHAQISEAIQSDSKRNLIKTKTTYPLDYPNITNPSDDISKGIKSLISRNIINFPIEQSLSKSNSDFTNSRVISSTLYSYNLNVPKPAIIYKSESITPITNFSFLTVSQTGTTISSTYKPKLFFDKYDNYGNALQFHTPSNSFSSYIWDYNNIYPVAEIKNADSASIAYTSFEADGTGNWAFSSTGISTSAGFTGAKCYTLSSTNTLTRIGLTSGNYIVTYWKKNGVTGTVSINSGSAGTSVIAKRGWTLYTRTLNSITSVTISGAGAVLDEVRLYPADAQMTTYTYSPLVGTTSQCDAANHVTMYEYDGLSRLSLIRDQDNNIIKKIDYHYNGQPETSPACSCDDPIHGKRCINDQCQQGVRVNTSTVKQGNGTFKCVYHWEWPNFSGIANSANITEYNADPCFID